MNPLTEKQIRTSFVNCSRREAAQLTLPLDLGDLRWDHLDYLGWIDRKAPLRAYVVLTVEDTLVGVTLRTPEVVAARRRAMCAWCEDVNATNDASMYVARRAGASGRNGAAMPGSGIAAFSTAVLHLAPSGTSLSRRVLPLEQGRAVTAVDDDPEPGS